MFRHILACRGDRPLAILKNSYRGKFRSPAVPSERLCHRVAGGHISAIRLRPNYVEIQSFCTATQPFASRDCCQRASMRALSILLASPRGFCAGVERAIQTVEETLNRFGAPVFVRHQIVHNPSVVAGLAAKGAVFVEELDEIPDSAPIVFSAHGVAKSVRSEAERRRLPHIDATCPLVTKVHREVEHHAAAGRKIILVGHAGHPEIAGTMGQAPSGSVILVQSAAEAAVIPMTSQPPTVS